MQITNILNPNNTLSVNRPLAHKLGLNAAIVYAALIAKQAYYESRGMLDGEGFFYSTIDDLEESTTLSRAQQQHALDVLLDAGLIEFHVHGTPPRRFFRVVDDENLLADLLEIDKSICEKVTNQSAENSHFNLQENDKSICEKVENPIYKTKEKKTKVINPNPSIAPCGEGTERTEDRERIFSEICENIESDCFPDEEGVYELVELATDVICSNRSTVRVNGGELPLEQVKRRFLELRPEHIENVLDTLEKNAGEIRNRRAYLVTLLYNAPADAKNSQPKNELKYDKYGIQVSSITDEMIQRRIMARFS